MGVMVLVVPVWSLVVGPQWRDWDLPVNERAHSVRFATAYPIADVIKRETPAGSKIFVAVSWTHRISRPAKMRGNWPSRRRIA